MADIFIPVHSVFDLIHGLCEFERLPVSLRVFFFKMKTHQNKDQRITFHDNLHYKLKRTKYKIVYDVLIM